MARGISFYFFQDLRSRQVLNEIWFHSLQETEKWLVKVPAFMYEAWQGITTDTVVGVVDVVPEGGAVKVFFHSLPFAERFLPLITDILLVFSLTWIRLGSPVEY